MNEIKISIIPYEVTYKTATEKMLTDLAIYVAQFNPVRRPIPDESYGEMYVAQKYADVTENGGTFLLALDGNRVIGICLAVIKKKIGSDLIEYKDVKTADICDLITDSSYRGKGIGSLLIARAEEDLRKQHCDVIKLTVMSKNTRAREFYERSGFEDSHIVMRKYLRSDI